MQIRLTAKAVTVVTFAVSAAIAINFYLQLHWWHPYCRLQADGPGYYAIGFPLPFAEPTGVSSMEYFIMPHIYILDELLLATIVGIFIVRLLPLLSVLHVRASVATAIAGSVVLLLTAGPQALIFTTGWWPRISIAIKPDRYVDYRPAFLTNRARDHGCDF